MNISDILKPGSVRVPLRARGKRAVIDELIDALDAEGLITDADQFKETVWDREQQRSTGIGEGLAIPHGKSECARELAIAIGRPERPIDFNSVDKKPVKLVVLLASPPSRPAEHIQALGKISRLMARPDFRKAAFDAQTSEEMLELFRGAE